MPIHGYPGNVITANPTAPTSSVATGVWTTEQQLIAKAAGNWPMGLTQISQSLRFNSADSAYLNRTPASSSNRRTWTWSGWFKRSTVVNVGQNLFSTDNGSSTIVGQLFFNDGILELNCYASSAYQWRLITTQVWRDLSAWYHIVAVVDTTQATSSDRVKLYVNGVQITAFTTATYPSQNFEGAYNLNQPHYIGASITSSGYLNGYLTEVNFIDGQALTPSSFGFNSSDTGVWSPKQYIGTYGTNGFYLKFDPDGGASFSADFLVIAGGGAGGSGNAGGGGGGAGGYRTSAGTSGGGGSAESALSLVTNIPYTVTVGAGGAAISASNYNTTRNNGSNSVFSTVTSTGGGGGSAGDIDGATGGSGGGGNGGYAVSPFNRVGGSGTANQGYAGGNGALSSGAYSAGGGGGAGAVGGAVSGTTAGSGGVGVASSITGSSVTRAGGGGGGSGTGTGGAGGTGGGGAGVSGSTTPATSGTANTGGGGGGTGQGGTTITSGAGGSGVVIIKIPDTRTATFSSGVTSSLSTAVAGFKIYTVTATSTTSETVTFS